MMLLQGWCLLRLAAQFISSSQTVSNHLFQNTNRSGLKHGKMNCKISCDDR